MSLANLTLFALEASRAFGERIAAHLNHPLAQHEEREFEDGEHKTRPLVGVRGRDVHVIQSLHGDDWGSVNDKLCRLLFFIGAVKDHGATRVSAIVPYLGYARKDRRTKPRDPVTTRYVASLFEAVGTDRIVTLEVHNVAAYQNAFRIPTEHLDTARLFAAHFAPKLRETDAVVVSPDAGGVKRAERFRQALSRALGRDLSTVFVEKYRSAGVVSGGAVVGDVAGKTAIVMDDLISTGTTMTRAAAACRARGAQAVIAAAAHGLFIGEASEVLAGPDLDRVVITDTVPPFRLDPDLVARKVTVLDAAGLCAEAIRRLHEGGSLVDLLEGDADAAVQARPSA
jgi:ribose-phosphate pyrophosphokinase